MELEAAAYRGNFNRINSKRPTPLPCQGHPEGNGLESITEYAGSIEKYVYRNTIENPIPVGHSMVGAKAIDIALRRPDLKG